MAGTSGSVQWLQLINESAYGVTEVTTPTSTYVRLDHDNAFTMRPKPLTFDIRSADARNERIIRVGGNSTAASPGREELKGTLTTYAYSNFGTGAGADTIPFMERVLGWATTLTSNDLPSFTIRHWDGIRAREYLGAKVESLELSAAPTSEEGVWKLVLGLVAQKYNATDPATFAEPAGTVFASAPFTYFESKGGLVIATSGTTARTIYNSLSLSIKNQLHPSWDEDRFITDCTYNGRTVELKTSMRFVSKADRDAYEGQTPHTTVKLTLTKASPARTLVLDLQGKGYLNSVDQALNLAAPTYESLTVDAFRDPATGANFGFTST